MIRVQCQRVVTMIDVKPVVDYIEEPNPPSAKGLEQRLLKSGTFALQGHDSGSKVHFRNVKVRVGYGAAERRQSITLATTSGVMRWK